MALFRTYQPYTRLGHFEMDGLLSRLDREIEERGENGEASTPYYVGARIAVHIARYHEFVDTQEEFMLLFDRALAELEGGEDGR